VEADLRPMNLGLATAKRRAQDRSAWRLLVATATSSTSSWTRRIASQLQMSGIVTSPSTVSHDCMIQGLNERFSTLHQEVALASKLVPSLMLKNTRCSETELESLIHYYPDMPSKRSFSCEFDRRWSKWQQDSSLFVALHWAQQSTVTYIKNSQVVRIGRSYRKK